MILQRCPGLDEHIKKYGCYLMSIFFLVNKYTNYCFDCATINELYLVLKSYGYIDKDCFVIDPDAIFNYLDMPVKYTQKHESCFKRCNDNEIEILLFQLIRPGRKTWKHFVAGNGRSVPTYDPWGCSKAVAEGSMVSKRIFKRL